MYPDKGSRSSQKLRKAWICSDASFLGGQLITLDNRKLFAPFASITNCNLQAQFAVAQCGSCRSQLTQFCAWNNCYLKAEICPSIPLGFFRAFSNNSSSWYWGMNSCLLQSRMRNIHDHPGWTKATSLLPGLWSHCSSGAGRFGVASAITEF